MLFKTQLRHTNGHTCKYRRKIPALPIYFQSAAASIDPSNRQRFLFFLRRCRRVRRVALSHEEYCFLKGSRGCVTLNLTGSATVELKLCEPRMKMIGSEGDCVVPARLSVRITTCLPCEVSIFYLRNPNFKKGPCGFLFIPLQEQLPHNKVAKFSNCT